MIVNVPLQKISSNPWQTRDAMDIESDYIKELAEDIARNGLLQAPMGRAMRDGSPVMLGDNKAVVESNFENDAGLSVQLAFGHNRLRACERLFANDTGSAWCFMKVPVSIRMMSNEQMAILAWSENEKRRDVTPVERAQAIQRLIDDFGWTQEQAAEHLGMSRPAVGNALRLLKLPEAVLEKLAEGGISERTATALLSLYDLPATLLEKAERWGNGRPSVIEKAALSGEWISDQIRLQINDICSRFGLDLQEAEFGLDEVFGTDEVASPTCRECKEFRIKDRNLCTFPGCYENKRRAAIKNYLEKASQACGIPVLEEGKEGYGSTTNFSWGDRNRKFEKIRTSGCENLRLSYVHGHELRAQSDGIFVEGFPNAMIVCNKREQFCTCLHGLEAAEEQVHINYDTDGPPEKVVTPSKHQLSSEQPSADELKELARAARQERRESQQEAKNIIPEVAERIATGLAMKNRDTWLKVAHQVSYSLNGETVWDIQVAIGQYIAEMNRPYVIERVEQVIEGMNELLTECGLEPLGSDSGERVLEENARMAAEQEH